MWTRLQSALVSSVLVVLAFAGSSWASDIDGDGVPDASDVCCDTLPGSIVDASGRPLGDLDGDCDVDLADYAIFAINFSGPSGCSPEVCDGLDNDCNCVPDDMGTISCGTGACYNEVPVCSNGILQSCTPLPGGPEVCNGIDDNCNGTVDDPFDLNTDVNNCGTCGLVCAALPNAPAQCQGGACGNYCDVDYGDCNASAVDGCEVYLPNNPNHCGACGLTCPAGPNASAGCAGNQCYQVCNVNLADCDVFPGNGCEVNTTNNLQHCGGCNMQCPPVPNGNAACVNSACALANCNFGYLDCNGIFLDGCEVNRNTDIQNCGTCGNVCPPRPNSTPTCSAGACGVNCTANFLNCNGNVVDGCEVNRLTDNNNCGVCGLVCPPETFCSNGACTAP